MAISSAYNAVGMVRSRTKATEFSLVYDASLMLGGCGIHYVPRLIIGFRNNYFFTG